MLPTTPDDPAYSLLLDDFTTTPVVHQRGCYICEDPEFARMGLPLCRKCLWCLTFSGHQGHVPADDTVCSSCEIDERGKVAWWYEDSIL